MAGTGKAVPTILKLTTPHSEQILMLMRSEGIHAMANMPKPWAAVTARTDNRRMVVMLPA